MSAPSFVVSPQNLARLQSSAAVIDFLTFDPLAPALPASRLLDGRADLPCRVENTVSPGFPIALRVQVVGAAEGVRVVGLFGLNVPAGSSIGILLYPTGDNTGPVSADVAAITTVDPGDAGTSQLVVTFADPVPCASAVVILFQPNASAWSGVFDIGELWIGRGFKPSRGIRFEADVGQDDSSEQLVSVGQQVYAVERTPARSFRLEFPGLTEAELFGEYGSAALSLWDIYKARGKSKPVVVAGLGDELGQGVSQVVPDAARSFLVQRLSFLGFMAADLRQRPVTRDGKSRVWSGSMVFRERL